MKRWNIIQKFIDTHDYKKYLEIGVSEGGSESYRAITCDYKVGVDPVKSEHVTHVMTSDEYFEKHDDTFDIIFVDGLHHADQVYRDITNGLKVLNDGGTIVCHDMLPTTENIQRVPREQGTWTGDCWKAWVRLRSEMSDLSMYVVDTDWGCGVIQKGSQNCISHVDETDMTWEGFCQNKNEWMNIKSTSEFLNSFLAPCESRYSIICASHDENILKKYLLSSPAIHDHQLIIKRGYDNVCKAYNEASTESENEIEIYVHHDVVLSEGFFGKLERTIETLGNSWGVLGVAGMVASKFIGCLTDRGRVLKHNVEYPYQVHTLDELLIVKRKGEFYFDDAIPSSHHLFGVDLCMQSLTAGKNNYVMDAYCEHHSKWVDGNFDESFGTSKDYLKEKWKHHLPIYTTCTTIK